MTEMVQANQDALITQDVPQAIQLLQEMGDNIQQVTQLVDNMLARVKRGEMSTSKGLSFLEMKYHTLLSYLINLTYVILRKCSGKSIEEDPAIERLVELRTVLEKIRPIDRRLKYQIDKLVKTAVTGGSAADTTDASRFRANPANMMSKLEVGSSDEDEEETEEVGSKSKAESENKKGLYVPPKLTPMHYDGDETFMTRQEKVMERARRRALSSSLVRELREEYMDVPIEMGANIDGISAGPGPLSMSRKQKERQEYEETYFTRLPESKEQRRRARKLPTIGSLGDELTNFGDSIDALEGRESSAPKRKRLQNKSRKGTGKKSLKKRKFH